MRHGGLNALGAVRSVRSVRVKVFLDVVRLDAEGSDNVLTFGFGVTLMKRIFIRCISLFLFDPRFERATPLSADGDSL